MFNESVADGISKWKMSDVGDFVSSPDSIFRFRWEKRESSHEFQKCSGKNVKTTPEQIRLENVPSPDVPIPKTVPDPRPPGQEEQRIVSGTQNSPTILFLRKLRKPSEETSEA